MKRIVLMSIITLLLLPSIAVFASDVSDARYITELVATNSAVSTKTNVISAVNLSSQDLIDSGMIAETVDDAALLKSGAIDAPFMPGYDTNPWMLFIDSIPFLSSESYYLYTGGATGGKIVYFPDTAGMTTPSIAGLGDNFTVTLSDVWIDTTAGAGKYIFNAGGFVIKVSPDTSSTILAGIAAIDEGTQSTSTYVALEGSVIRAGERLNSFPATIIHSASFYISKTNNPTGIITCTVRAVTGDTLLGNLGTINCSDITGADWYEFSTTQIENPSLQDIRIQLEYADGDGSNYIVLWADNANPYASGVQTKYIAAYTDTGANDIDFNVVYEDEFISLSNVSSGEYDIVASADETNLTLDLNGSSNSTVLGGASVPDTSNDIISFESDTVLYAGSQEIEVDGVQKQYVEWQYGDTFEDQSGNGNDATPTFRTTTNDADVDVSIYSQYSTAEQGSPAVADIGGFTMIGSTPAEPPGLFDSGGSTFPGSTEIANLASATRIPYVTWCYIFAFFSAMLGGAGIYGLTHSVRLGRRGSMLLMDLTMIVILCLWIFGGGGVISGFVLVPFVIILIFLLMIRNPQSPVVG